MSIIRLDDWNAGQSKMTPDDLMGSFRRVARQAYEGLLAVLEPKAPPAPDLQQIARTLLLNQHHPDVPKAIQAQNRKSNPDVTSAFISVDSDGFIKMERAFQAEYKGQGPYPGVYMETSFYTPEGEHRGGDTPVAYLQSLREWESEQLRNPGKVHIPIESDPVAQTHHYARAKDTHYPGTSPLPSAA